MVEVHLKNDSRRLYYDCVVNAIVKGDEVTGASVLARDITGQREKEQRFTQLFESLQEGVYISNPDGKLVEVNPALVSILGYASKEELLNLAPAQLNVDANSDAGAGTRRQPKRTHSHARSPAEKKRWRRRGVRRYLDRRDGSREGCPIPGHAGRRHRKARARTYSCAARKNSGGTCWKVSLTLILVLDLKGQYTFVSARIAELLGYGPDHLLGQNVDDAEKTSPELAALYRHGRQRRECADLVEYGSRHRDGSWRTMLGMASPLLDAEGKPAGVIISVRDVTMEKKLEQQIIQSERLAAMGQMIGGFAHELNNPLTSILGMAELLQEGEISEGARKQLTILHQQARRAAEIVQNLQYFARPPAPGRSQVDLNELVQRTVQMQAYPLRKSNITVDFLPEPADPRHRGRSQSADAGVLESAAECGAGHPRKPRERHDSHAHRTQTRFGMDSVSG